MPSVRGKRRTHKVLESDSEDENLVSRRAPSRPLSRRLTFRLSHLILV